MSGLLAFRRSGLDVEPSGRYREMGEKGDLGLQGRRNKVLGWGLGLGKGDVETIGTAIRFRGMVFLQAGTASE